MAKVELKTKETEASVEDFLNALVDVQERTDAFRIVEMMKDASGSDPKMWGPSIVGFGNKVHTSPATGREVDWMKIGFSPRKAGLALYSLIDRSPEQKNQLAGLGKYKTGKGCLYIKRLSDVDEGVLKKLIAHAYSMSD